LEDGLGWEQICPFLGEEIPDVKYPRGNDPQEFAKLAKQALSPVYKRATAAVVAMLIPAIGIGAWYLMRSRI